MRFFMLY